MPSSRNSRSTSRGRAAGLREILDLLDLALDFGIRLNRRFQAGLNPGPSAAPDPYDLLGMTPQMPAADKKRRYKHLQRKVHPDKGGDTQLSATINEAWKTIADLEGIK